MPEGPEVSTVTRQLRKALRNWILVKIEIVSGPYQNNTRSDYLQFRTDLRKRFVTSTLSNVASKGKTMYFELTPVAGDEAVVTRDYISIGLGMTGGFCFDKQGQKNVRIQFVFESSNGKRTKKLYYIDSRNFGTMKFMRREELNEKLNSLGPTIMNMQIDADEFAHRFTPSSIQNNEIAKALMNQKIISGIGNYLRAEILYEAGVSPKTKVKDMKNADYYKIYEATKKIVKEVMAAGGTVDYRDTANAVGKYKFKVYRQTKSPNGKQVRKLILAKRTVYYVE